MARRGFTAWFAAWCCAAACVGAAAGAGAGAGGVQVAEAQEGETATLPCPSIDDDHNFLFWQLEDDEVIGPANRGNEAKYKYEVLSGELQIKRVGQGDAGQYKCVAKGVHKPSFQIKPIDLVVKKDWELLWENDTNVNLLRGVLAMLVIAVLCGIAFVMMKMRRTGYVKGDDLSDDDMPEDVGEGPYQSTTRRASQDLSLVDTELPRALNSMYNDRI